MKLLIKDGHVINPESKLDGICDILIEKGKIVKIAKNLNVADANPVRSKAPGATAPPAAGTSNGAKIISAKGKLVLPGLIDIHTHLRVPGREDEETLLSGMQAAARGGFTTICCMPNTQPVIDHAQVVQAITKEAGLLGLINIIPIGAITKGQKGEELTELADLKEAGCRAVSDDGFPVVNAGLLRRAFEYASMLGLLVISHCEDLNLSRAGLMNEGLTSTILGLKGIPEIAETVIVSREIELARYLNIPVHLAHISSSRSIELIKQAKEQGIKITAETCPHYFSLTQDLLMSFDTNLKVNPPLRRKEDVEKIKLALKEGIIDCIATDHAPHSDNEKELEFDLAASGTIGLETALAVSITELINKDILSWQGLVRLMSLNPARILGLDKGSLREGKEADLIVLDPNEEWVVKKEDFLSRSRNCAFLGMKLKGVVEYTICNGKIVYKR
ncbi:MAG: dihydroorotase [Candidatus Omnitrophica bacterium]|nr:dihydroorotase [Candidatus Omnitrophota bacterium]